uniref:Uncharacterized protein n=1 Tax=Panagrolaimus sp. ES5 TaxID=591445 RepID=A0AC34FL82_9BILA
MAEKMAALKNKSFGKTIESGAFSQKPFAPVMIHAAGLSKVETSGSDNIECLESSEDSIENLTTNVEKLTVESADESCIAYSSQEMLSVRDSKTSEDWAVYAKMKSEWDTKNSPFEFDSELRISFELQLRVLRARETESLRQRQEMLGILKPKTAMVKEEIKTVFPSSVMGCSAITTSNKDDCPDLETFFKRLNDFCKNFKDEKHVGPAVFARPSSGQTSNIFEIAKRLDAEFASKEKT